MCNFLIKCGEIRENRKKIRDMRMKKGKSERNVCDARVITYFALKSTGLQFQHTKRCKSVDL